MSDGITDAYTSDRWRDAKASNPGLDPRVNLISRQENGKWRAIETGIGAMTLHAEADSLAELIAGPDAITLPIEQAIAKAAKLEALAALLALRDAALFRCLNSADAEYGVNLYFELIEAEMAKL